VELDAPADPAGEEAVRAALAAAGGETLPAPTGTWRARITAPPTEIDAALATLTDHGLRRLVRAGAVAMTTTPDPTAPANGEPGT
jgi:acetolactate synthase small subunit